MAIANDIALYALGYWSHEQHPIRINSICLNTRQRKHPCRACTDVCPQGIVLHSGKAIWKGCINCNLCVTACPTAAINQSFSSFSHIRSLILEGNAPVSFACQRVEEHSDVHCSCLATVPWDLVAAAALKSGVVLKADACKECPHESLVQRVKELVRNVRHFLGKEQFEKNVFLHEQAGSIRSSGVDKRLAFTKITESVVQASEVALEGQTEPTMSCYRALLLEVLSEAQNDNLPFSVTWNSLIEDHSCTACEICVKMCPHKALELQIPGYTDKEDESEGESADIPDTETSTSSTEQILFQNVSKCTQCGLCYISCPHENLGGWEDFSTNRVPAMRAFPVSVSLCEKCGRPFKPKDENDTHCAICNKQQFSFQKK